jgi:hypothetical protein
MKYLAISTPGLPATIQTALKFSTRAIYGSDGQFDGSVVDGAKLIGEHDEATLRIAIAAAARALQPGGIELAMFELGTLRSKTISRKTDDGDAHLTGRAYGEVLAVYPADVIRGACREWADGSKWWPAWAELKAECDRLCAKRLAEHRALTEALKRSQVKPAPALSARKPLATEIERRRVSVLMRRQAGDDRTAARFEIQLAAKEGRPPEQWAQDVIAAQLAEQKKRAEEYQAAADAEKAKPKPVSEADAYLAAKAQARRDAILGIKRESAADQPSAKEA